jgi:hypothetical protein
LGKCKALNLGELKDLIQIKNKTDRKRLKDPEKTVKIDYFCIRGKIIKISGSYRKNRCIS